VLAVLVAVSAGAPPLPAQDAGGAEQQGSQQEKLIEPSRPTIANSAEVQRPGVLQLEAGYSDYTHGTEFRDEESLPLTLRFAASRRLLLAADVDATKSELVAGRARSTGVGDTWVGAQAVAVAGAERHPAVGGAYFVKLPTASEREGLGTGRVDHRVVLLVSRQLGETDVDLNAAYLNVGREGSGRREAGGQVALAVSREPERRGVGVQGELADESVEASEPRGAFAMGALLLRLSERTRLDAGARVGLTHASPRAEAFAGITTALTR
jgi:hypothetical protein